MEHNIQKQLKIISSGIEEIIPAEELEKKLKRAIEIDKPLRVKLGLDPSAPDIHLGHAVVLRKLRQFQDLGHLAVLIVGDFTGMVGDPSSRTHARQPLTADEVRTNAITYVNQVCQILDSNKIEVVYNSQWLSKLTMEDVLRLTSCFTVARMLERDDFAKRYQSGRPISLVEFLYPLLQGWDSVIVRADAELGGTDQKFNLLVGRELQREYGQEPQVILTMPLLEGTNGVQKMSKSLGNYIGITEPAKEIFGKVMSIPDNLIIKYFRLATNLDADEIVAIEKGLAAGSLHPGEIKRHLAREIVNLFHGKKLAEQAEEEFNRIFREKEIPLEMPEFALPKDDKIWIIKLLVGTGLAKSRNEARRLIEQGGAKLNGQVLRDAEIDFSRQELIGAVLQAGKRNFVRLVG